MSKPITCRPWNVVDRVKHKHPRKHDREVREWYVNRHAAMEEGQLQICTQPCAMMLKKQGKRFVIEKFDYVVDPTTKQLMRGK